jgi:hypothetical protein
MSKKEPTAIELIEMNKSIIDQQITLNTRMSELRQQMKEKEEEINDKITAELIDFLGRDVKVITAVNQSSVTITIVHYGFTAVYRDSELIIEKSNERQYDIKLSVMNAVSDAIDKILKTEGLL